MKKPTTPTSTVPLLLFPSPTVQAGWQQEPHISDFKMEQKLGSGSFGTVFKAVHRRTAKVYAIKEIRKSALGSQKLREHARNQVRIMYVLNHPNIIKLYNHFQDQLSIFLILQYAPLGQLYTHISSNPQKRLSQPSAALFTSQIVSALQQIHSNNIMHRDLKLQNILLTDSTTAKIADFGWSHFLEPEQKRTTYCGTLDYLAPEMLESGHRHDWRVDLWSVGVLLFQMCVGWSPFSCGVLGKDQGKESKDVKISVEGVKNNIRNVVFTVPEGVSQEAKSLITGILRKKPEERLGLKEIMGHPWMVKNLGLDKVEEKMIKEDNWVDVLVKEMKEMFPETVARQKDKGYGFTNEEIYRCTRPDSIISGNYGKKGQYQQQPIQQQKQFINLKSPKIPILTTQPIQPCPSQSKPSTSPSYMGLTLTQSQQSSTPVSLSTSTFSHRKLAQLQLKLTQLQLQNKTQKQQLSKLREQLSYYKNKDAQSTSPSPSTSNSPGHLPAPHLHRQCNDKIKQLMQQILKQNRNMEIINAKLGESQRKLFLYEVGREKEKEKERY